MCSFRILFVAAAAFLALVARAEDPAPRVIPQELVNRQPAMIDARVRAISERSAPGPRGFFLGFAGVGEERVFSQEIGLAEQRLGARFGLEDRSLRLVNDQRDLEAYPLASVAALRYALKALGRVMDDDDVLFLALASHGWKDATIAISNAGMRPDALSAKDLAAMLAEAGIRWRVIVVSACYAGSFIKPLADDHTILISAAAKNRPSFGCGADSELTYFGEAFYRDALPDAPTLREAFEAARLDIAAREKAEGERASNPQAWFGELMERKLDAFESARDRQGLDP
ncbi:MAG TPA: C13 family peptidase [Steroidobacteraceae bacterium]